MGVFLYEGLNFFGFKFKYKYNCKIKEQFLKGRINVKELYFRCVE